MTNYWFISTKYRHSSKLALFTFLFAFVVITMGAYTRLTNAGLSCPDWPHCYGYLTAPHTTSQIKGAIQKYPQTPVDVKKAWTEMTHRYAAMIEGLLILVLSFSILFSSKAKDLKATIIALGLIALLCVQVILGKLTVTEQLKPVIVLSHLVTGISILCLLWWAYLDLHLRDDSFMKRTNAWLPLIIGIGFIIMALQVTLGGWVSTHYASLACIDFPYCNGVILPEMQWNNLGSDLITIHMLHRIGALITAIYLLGLGCILITNHSYRSLGLLIIALLTLQITLGILNIIWLRPVFIALFHQSIAIILLLTVLTALVKAHITSRNHHGSFLA